MNQDIERLEHLTHSTPEEQINPMTRSNEERRRRQAKELKEKAEDEKRKDGKRKTADRLMLSDSELLDENNDENKQDNSGGDKDPPVDSEELNKETSDGHLDLKA